MVHPMKQTGNALGICAALLAGLLLIACETQQPAVKPAPVAPAPAPVEPVLPPSPPADTPEQIAEKAARASAVAERDGIVALYNSGDYRGAVKRSTAALEDVKVYKDLELDILKFSAFSYCLMQQKNQCRQQFEKALKLDPAFTLEAGEIGHPLWWPVFQQAKKKEGIK